jgi:hypothetical protein
MDPIVFRVVKVVPSLGLEPGDDVVFDPKAPRLFTRLSPVDPGAALLQYESGAIEPITPAPLPADLARAVGAHLPPGPPTGGQPRLLRLK